MELRAMTLGKLRKRYRDLCQECLHDEIRQGGPAPMGMTRWPR
jgi:hypothetical protein